MHTNTQKDAGTLAFGICSAIHMVWYVYCIFIFLYKYIYIYCVFIFVRVWYGLEPVVLKWVLFPYHPARVI